MTWGASVVAFSPLLQITRPNFGNLTWFFLIISFNQRDGAKLKVLSGKNLLASLKTRLLPCVWTVNSFSWIWRYQLSISFWFLPTGELWLDSFVTLLTAIVSPSWIWRYFGHACSVLGSYPVFLDSYLVQTPETYFVQMKCVCHYSFVVHLLLLLREKTEKRKRKG